MCMNQTNREPVIVAYGRSPVGRARKGSLATTHPVDFAAETLKGVLARVPSLNPAEIDDVLVGCAQTSGHQSKNLGRLIAMRAELPVSVSGATVCRACSSSLQTIAMAASAIMANQADVVIAGGVESMSLMPMGESDPATLSQWLNQNSSVYMPMGITAENVAVKYGVSRQEMEQMAVESHAKAHAAQISGAFDREIVPIPVTTPEGNQIIMTKDEGIRPETSLEGLSQLKPCFKEDGQVTAATSSQTSDGAAFVVLMSSEKAQTLQIKPIGRLVAFAVAGVPAEIMGTGPMAAVPKVLKRAGMTLDEMDVIELNEAFAAQAIPCIKELGLDKNKLNPRGGALALGHPMGATGAILTSRALSYLEDVKGHYALITMCVGGGMGAAGIIERF